MSLLDPTELTEDEDGARLLVDRDLNEGVDVDEVDRMRGLIELPGHGEIALDSVRDGRLALGLWRRRGPFDVVDGVPVEVACGGRADLAACLYLGLDRNISEHRPRAVVADLLDVESRRTISNYLSDVRLDWDEL